MKILIIGAGRIGSTFAFHLSLAGHRVDVLARGKRLEFLRRESAIVTTDGRRATINVRENFNTSLDYDIVVVTVLAHQLDAILPLLIDSCAKSVLLMFNTFELTAPWRNAIGKDRFVFGFPTMIAYLVEGKLQFKVDSLGMVTTLTSEPLAKVFRQAKMPSAVESDIDSFLRSHVAFVVPLMMAGNWTWRRSSGLSWSESSILGRAMIEGFALVHALGHNLKPLSVAIFAQFPLSVLTVFLWMLSRTAGVRNLGEFGPKEASMLIDAMIKAGPNITAVLKTIRPSGSI